MQRIIVNMEKFNKKDRSTWPYFWAQWMGESMYFYLTCAFENCMKPLLDEMNLND